MNGKCFIDSNVWIYLLSNDDTAKKDRAITLLSGMRYKVISWQVINEVCANLVRKKHKDESFVRIATDFMFGSCELADFSRDVLANASELRSWRMLSFWDSLVLATALTAGCDAFVSEDMQDGQMFGHLRVTNIFN
jgi:predicted nucleic acid-binding protein